jgi:hypothetical protein
MGGPGSGPRKGGGRKAFAKPGSSLANRKITAADRVRKRTGQKVGQHRNMWQKGTRARK